MQNNLNASIEGYQASPVSEGESGATVYRLTKPGQPTLYLKSGKGEIASDIREEMLRLQWLAARLPVPQVIAFEESQNATTLLTTALPGRSAENLLHDPTTDRSVVVYAIAQFLHRIHALPAIECPFDSTHRVRMNQARRRIDLGLVDESDFDECRQGWTAQQVWDELTAMLPLPFEEVVTHGDFSLENIFLEGNQVTGCIDTGRVGIADPYQDLAILWNNLEEFGAPLQAQLFLDYGIADPDLRMIQFHLCLDELF